MKAPYLAIAAGAAGTALTLEICYIPYHLIDGGVTGLAVLVARSLGQSPVWLLLLFNLAALLIATKTLGHSFLLKVALGFSTGGLVLLVTGPLPPLLPVGAAALLGGICNGTCTALVLRAGGAMDACEVFSQIARSLWDVPIPWSILLVNGSVLLLILALHPTDSTRYTVIAQSTTQVLLHLLVPHRSASVRLQ